MTRAGEYAVRAGIASVQDYLRLRSAAGLSPRSAEAAAAGLPNSICGALACRGTELVGMARVIGDGGLFFQVVDVAVDPAHQRRGLGRAFIAVLMEELNRRLPAEAYVSLIADGDADRLYAEFGFAPTAPGSIGMAQWLR